MRIWNGWSPNLLQTSLSLPSPSPSAAQAVLLCFFLFSLPTSYPCFSQEPTPETLECSFLNDDPKKAQINPDFLKEHV